MTTISTDRSIPPHIGHGTRGRCGLCATPAARWAAGSTPEAHMWVCEMHADSRFTTEPR